MQPTSKFGEVFQYSNLMAAAAGYIAGATAMPGKEWGAAYDAAMRTKVFEPLGMSTTTFDFDRGVEGRRRASSWRRRRRPADAGAHGPELLGRSRPARGRRLDERERARQVRRDGAGEGPAPAREAARLRAEPPRPLHTERDRGRGRDLRHGAHGRHALRDEGGPSRRRPRGLSQRHDLAARSTASALCSSPTRTQACISAVRYSGGCSRCSSTAGRRPRRC